ncbi:hypothetical protein LINPERPRIM_LOCUS36868 [Linum perenne]
MFTIELHYGGVMIGDAYRYGHIAYMDMVDPDKLSLHELNKMVEYLGVYGGIFEYLWLTPGEKFKDGLKPLHCDDDVRDLCAGVTVEKNICVYINKLSEFQARKRLALLQRRMFEVVTKRRGVVIEEVVQAGPTGGMLALEYEVGDKGGLPSEGEGTSTTLTTHRPLPTPPPSPHVQVTGSPTSQPVEAPNPTPPASPPVQAPNPTPPASPPVEAPNPTPPTSPPVQAPYPTPPTSTCQTSQRTPNPYHPPSSPHEDDTTNSSTDSLLDDDSSDDESFRADERELGDGMSEDASFLDESFTYDEEAVEESIDRILHSRANSAGYKHKPRKTPIFEDQSTVDSNDNDGHYDEFDLLDQTGWGSEAEDVEPSSFPTFQPDRDLDDSELRLGTVFESLDQFKQLCKANAVKQRRGVKFPTNDKKRCRCECQKGCGFWLYASVDADTRDVKLRSGHMTYECAVDDDIRAATCQYLASK